jgi:hypothetical protein
MEKDLEKVEKDLEEAIVRLRLALRSLLRETLLFCRDVCLGMPLFCRDVYRLAICRRRRLTGGKAHGE